MRRIPLSLAVTAACTAVTCTLSAVPAQAAGGSLTVTTIGRNGARVTSALTMTNIRTHQTLNVKSGRRIALAKGTWAVITDIETPDKSPYAMSDTLTAVEVTVSGNAAVTLDARRGRPVTASVDATSGAAAAGYSGLETADICPANDPGTVVGVYNVPGQIFLVPNAKATYFNFAWMRTWSGDQGGSGYYAVSKQTAGLPVAPTAAFRRSAMAKVSTYLRSGETAQPVNALRATPAPVNFSCQQMLYGYSYMPFTNSAYSTTTYLSPGRWSLQGYNSQGAQDTLATAFRTVAGGGGYAQTFGRAVWGPSAGLPFVTNRSLTYTPYRTISDASTVAATDATAATRNVITLRRSGKVLKTQTITSTYGIAAAFSARIAAAGWYDLSVSATRVQKAPLSTGVTLAWHFRADPARTQIAPGYLAELTPTALNLDNRAIRGTTTPVTVALSRTDMVGATYQPRAAETVKSLTVYASHDGGRSWHAVGVRRSGGQWVAAVPEPATAGAVSLRTVVVDTAGDTSTQTVLNAYLVG